MFDNNKKNVVIIAIVLAILIILANEFRLNWMEKKLTEELDGKILATMKLSENENCSIYSMSLNEDGKIEKYFGDDSYDEILFAQKRDSDFICTAKNLKTGYYTILQVKENKINEIMTSQTHIMYPILLDNDEEIVFVQGSCLYKYNIKNKSLTTIYDDPSTLINNPMILSDDSIIFATDENILRLYSNGETEKLARGISPTWLEQGKNFIYFDNKERSVIIYDISTKIKKVIKKNISIRSSIQVSPDKKYIIFFERREGGPTVPFLKVMTIDGWQAKKGISKYSGFISPIYWIK